jgi:carboxylesterase
MIRFFGSSKAVQKHDSSVSRDPETGILLGAEPRWLGPEHASKAILFVHGFLGTGNNFYDLPDHAADDGWRVRVMLLPGHGTSPFTLEKTTADELISAVIQELRELRSRYETVVICGHSMGGALATLAASQMPLDGLILIAPYFAITFKWYYLFPAESWGRALQPILRWIYNPPNQKPVKRREVSEQILAYTYIPVRALCTAASLSERVSDHELLDRINCPTLLLHAVGDQVTSPEAAARAFALMGNAQKRAVWVRNSDHILCWDYDREQVAQEVRGFLGGLK